ncbi:MAG: VanZ family protein [Alphaproteobacteria bacterium]|nr:VanZ family protein [Alphaproteobacteria bacterium]
MRFLRFLAVWLFWPGVALIAWGELTPNPPTVAQHIWDKAEHFTAYFGLAAMATLVVGLRRPLAWAILGIIALGGVLEILQGLLGRDAELGDFIANTTGALVGLAVAAVFIRITGQGPLVGGGRRH